MPLVQINEPQPDPASSGGTLANFAKAMQIAGSVGNIANAAMTKQASPGGNLPQPAQGMPQPRLTPDYSASGGANFGQVDPLANSYWRAP